LLIRVVALLLLRLILLEGWLGLSLAVVLVHSVSTKTLLFVLILVLVLLLVVVVVLVILIIKHGELWRPRGIPLLCQPRCLWVIRVRLLILELVIEVSLRLLAHALLKSHLIRHPTILLLVWHLILLEIIDNPSLLSGRFFLLVSTKDFISLELSFLDECFVDLWCIWRKFRLVNYILGKGYKSSGWKVRWGCLLLCWFLRCLGGWVPHHMPHSISRRLCYGVSHFWWCSPAVSKWSSLGFLDQFPYKIISNLKMGLNYSLRIVARNGHWLLCFSLWWSKLLIPMCESTLITILAKT
jgi:hypothetical protein